MSVYETIVARLWLVLVVVWIVSAFGVKPTVGGGWNWRSTLGVRAIILVLVMLAIRDKFGIEALRSAGLPLLNTNPIAGVGGVVLCALGVGFAVWARVHLGRNWGTPMSQRVDPELVTTGPYAFVRHPIYTGFIVAIVGSAIGGSLLWAIPLVLFTPYFVYSAKREEAVMAARFPEAYPAYMQRTRMLIPFVW